MVSEHEDDRQAGQQPANARKVSLRDFPGKIGPMPPSITLARAGRDIYTVSRLNLETQFLLAEHFGLIWVEGEISNLSTPTSGHFYFTLKDVEAQVRCAMFRTQNRRLVFKPENGCQVLVKAQVSLYESRGDFQLIVEQMEEAGDGALRRAFEQLKQKLAAEGLFAAEHKRALPSIPQSIGVITSPSGAAIRDILTVLRRRFPAIPVILYPAAVQGADAPREIVRALALADRRRECDVLLLARGGGSLEDLWAFNDPAVARAIFDCAIPVVTGIGHETDFTIADFVADFRAATPSAAAEAVTPDRNEWLARFVRLETQLTQRIAKKLEIDGKSLLWLEKRLRLVHPRWRTQERAQRLDESELRITRGIRNRIGRLSLELGGWAAKLHRHHPLHRIASFQAQTRHLYRRLQNAMGRDLEKRSQTLSEASHALQTVSPLATLSRGYAIVYRCDDGNILRSNREAAPGDGVEARLAEGRLICKVEKSLDDAL